MGLTFHLLTHLSKMHTTKHLLHLLTFHDSESSNAELISTSNFPREDRPGRCPEGLAFWTGLSWAVLSTAQLQGGVFFQGGYKSQAFTYV